MSEEEIQWLSEVIEEYVSIRKYFLGHFYNFGSDQFDSSAWVIWQYHDPSSDEGMVMALSLIHILSGQKNRCFVFPIYCFDKFSDSKL